jgi:antitoxin (DNA-binding transcriptional repressor) of toxin-antitoxin stability system
LGQWLTSASGTRNHGGGVLDAVARGESVTVTRHGSPVAESRPLTSDGVLARDLVHRWRTVPLIDLAALRSDLDEVLDPAL